MTAYWVRRPGRDPASGEPIPGTFEQELTLDVGGLAHDPDGAPVHVTWLQQSRKPGQRIALAVTPDADIERVVTALHDHWRVDRIGPGHCTGEPAFAAFRRVFAAQYVYAGLGSSIDVP